MKTRYTIFALSILLGVLSCNEETVQPPPKGPTFGENTADWPIDSNDIYYSQTDKNRMLNSMIRYDYTQKKYILDLSEQDASSIGITTQMYKDALKRVEEMNKVNIERLQWAKKQRFR